MSGDHGSVCPCACPPWQREEFWFPLPARTGGEAQQEAQASENTPFPTSDTQGNGCNRCGRRGCGSRTVAFAICGCSAGKVRSETHICRTDQQLQNASSSIKAAGVIPPPEVARRSHESVQTLAGFGKLWQAKSQCLAGPRRVLSGLAESCRVSQRLQGLAWSYGFSRGSARSRRVLHNISTCVTKSRNVSLNLARSDCVSRLTHTDPRF